MCGCVDLWAVNSLAIACDAFCMRFLRVLQRQDGECFVRLLASYMCGGGGVMTKGEGAGAGYVFVCDAWRWRKLVKKPSHTIKDQNFLIGKWLRVYVCVCVSGEGVCWLMLLLPSLLLLLLDFNTGYLSLLLLPWLLSLLSESLMAASPPELDLLGFDNQLLSRFSIKNKNNKKLTGL